MTKNANADVVIAGTGIVGCLIAEQLLDAGLSVLMLEAGPRIDRSRVVENYRNLPPMPRVSNPDMPYPPKPWALHPEEYTGDPEKDYLITTGPDAHAYRQTYIRYAGGSTWHWAGLCWRLTPDDMRLHSKYGVGRDWPFDYAAFEPYYTRAEYAIGVCGPDKPEDQWPPIRSKPYPMPTLPFSAGQQRCVDAAKSIGHAYIPIAQARNSMIPFQGRPPCAGNNNCMPVCPIGAKYDAYGALLRLEAKGATVIENAVVYKVETNAKNNAEAFHYYTPDKISNRVTGKVFVIACNGIESPKILLMSKNDKNPNGVANSSDQVGRNMMDQPKYFVKLEFSEPAWSGLGPVLMGALMSSSQGDFRSQHAGAQIAMMNASPTGVAALEALKKGLVGKALDLEIRRLSACSSMFFVEHEILPDPNNRLTLSDKKDALGLPKPSVYYDVGDYVRRSAEQYSLPLATKFAHALGAAKFERTPGFSSSQHIMGGAIMGEDSKTSVVDPDCRTHDHENLFVPGGANMPSAGSGNSTLTMAALAVKAGDAILNQLKRA